MLYNICERAWDNPAKVAIAKPWEIQRKGKKCVNRSKKVFWVNINYLYFNYSIPELQIKENSISILI